jgi:hypothetical protein
MKAKKTVLMLMAVFMVLIMAVSVHASTPNGIEALSTSMTSELSNILPILATAAGNVIGSVAPIALTIAGMVAVVSLTISVFRRLTGK